MPLIIAVIDSSTRLNKPVALIQLTRQETDTLRARDFISRSLNENIRPIVPFKSFAVREKV